MDSSRYPPAASQAVTPTLGNNLQCGSRIEPPNLDHQETFDHSSPQGPDQGSEDDFEFSQFLNDDLDMGSNEDFNDWYIRTQLPHDGPVERLPDANNQQKQESLGQTLQQQPNVPLSGQRPDFNQRLNAHPVQRKRAPGSQQTMNLPATEQIFKSYGPPNAVGIRPTMNHIVGQPTECQQLQPILMQPSPVPIAPQVRAQHPFYTPLEVQVSHPGARITRATTDFPDLEASMRHPVTGLQCEGTYRQLFNQYPELRPGIQSRFLAWEKGKEHQPQVRPNKCAGKNPPMVNLGGKRASSQRPSALWAHCGIRQGRQLIATPAASPVSSHASTSLSSVHTSPVPSIDSSDRIFHAGPAEDDDADFDLEHESVQAALEYIERPPAEVCEKLEIEGDDWKQFAGFSDHFKSHCQQLFNALQKPGGAAPDDYSQDQKIDYEEKHAFVRAKVVESMQLPEQIRAVKARVIKAMSVVVRVHEVGIPRATMHATRKARGFSIDKQSTCMQRARKVISAASTSKYVARDILNSENLVRIALSPDEYLKRKFTNSGGNRSRGEKLKAAAVAKKGSNDPDIAAGEVSPPDTVRALSVIHSGVQSDLQAPGIGPRSYPSSNGDLGVESYGSRSALPGISMLQGAQAPESSRSKAPNSRKRGRADAEDDLDYAEMQGKLARLKEIGR